MPWDFWLIFLILGVLIPWRGRVRLQRLLAEPVTGTKQKLTLYGTTIAFQWILTGMVAWRAVARGLTPPELGLDRRFTLGLWLTAVVGSVLLGVLQWFNLRRVSRLTGPAADFMRRLAERLLPGNAVELLPYCALAITAGVCEEFLYRGFAMAAITRMGMAPWAVVATTSLLFGLAHAYQGKSGIIGTSVLGLLFGAARIVFASLGPGMAWHSAVDVAAGMAGRKFFLQAQKVS
jgi:membrane protease YdiL (CAAX protease family)